MGMKMSLIVVEGAPESPFGDTVLQTVEGRGLAEAIRNLASSEGQVVHPNFHSPVGSRNLTSYAEDKSVPTTEDGEGNPVYQLPAGKLLRFASHPDVKDGHYLHAAIWAFLAALPEDQLIACYPCQL